MKLILKLLLNALAVFLTANALPGVILKDYGTAIGVAIVLGLLNLMVKPILVILTLPINILSLGLFSLVINALMIQLASIFLTGFRVKGFLTALIFSLLLSLITSLLRSLLK